MSQEVVLDPQLQARKDLAWWLYIFHGLSLIALGLPSWIPLIISIVKRGETAGTFVYSHHTWQIRSFIWYVVWVGVAGIFVGLLWWTLIAIPIGWAIGGIAWIWYAYRVIRGFVDLGDNKPMPV